MSEQLAFTLLTVVANAGATWGVVSTKLAWLRRDLDRAHERLDALESNQPRRKAQH